MAHIATEPDTVFVTGFPGFIAGRLVQRLWASEPHPGRYCFLVQRRFAYPARAACEAMARRFPQMQGRWQVVVGDITRPDLGLGQAALTALRAEVTRVWHLAAIYDLAVAQSTAWRINVDGTRHVLDLCESMPHLKTLLYISTCYVAGTQPGKVLETELDRGQAFANHYEATKFHAEKEVCRRALPTIIFRPAIVVGDSASGQFAKVDGPYHLLQLLTRLPTWMPIPRLGGGETVINLVPVDWVVDAMVQISNDARAVGRTFHLADPDPPTTADVLALMVQALGRRPPRGRVPMSAIVGLARSGLLAWTTHIPAELMPYMVSGADFDVSNTAELLTGCGLRCPRFGDYVDTLVRWATHHPHLLQGAHP